MRVAVGLWLVLALGCGGVLPTHGAYAPPPPASEDRAERIGVDARHGEAPDPHEDPWQTLETEYETSEPEPDDSDPPTLLFSAEVTTEVRACTMDRWVEHRGARPGTRKLLERPPRG